MGNRRFSLTTYVLVGISLVALYFVGKTVTPPPPAPPKDPTPVAAKAPPTPPPASPDKMKFDETRAKEEAKARADRMKALAANAQKNPTANTKAFNPTSIDTDSDYWQHAEAGEKGVKEMRTRVAEALAKQKTQPVVPVQQKPSPINRSQ
ncbi:MAG: hypothetical protein JWL77_5694 [Chthonomonadaceae bacterium]|nr:hypothetical protein [Chthonomonadaceae bacterium]